MKRSGRTGTPVPDARRGSTRPCPAFTRPRDQVGQVRESGAYEVAAYHACMRAGATGDRPVMVVLDLDGVEAETLAPDMAHVEDPPVDCVDMDAAELRDAWEASGRTWRDSLEIAGALVVRRDLLIDPEMVESVDPDHLEEHGVAAP